ncbi:MAG: DUF4249 family protein [Rhodothermales bacterium]
MKTGLYILPLTVLLLTAACDSTDPGAFEEAYVVEGYLVAAEPLQPVRLSRTTLINQRYDFTALAVRDATVRVHLLAPDGSIEATVAFQENEEEPGVYLPEDHRTRVQPLRTYRLDVEVPGTRDRIAATTVVPDTFSVVAVNTDTVVYQGTEQFEMTMTRSRSPGREQSYYIFVTEALDPREEHLTPLVKDFFDSQDGDITLDDLRVNGSTILNEETFDLNADGTITIKYPWLAVAFFGPNRVSTNAIDDNLYDHIRSQMVQQGGSTFSPGEIPNVIEHVEGAHGVFGSYARVSHDLLVLRPDFSERTP